MVFVLAAGAWTFAGIDIVHRGMFVSGGLGLLVGFEVSRRYRRQAALRFPRGDSRRAWLIRLVGWSVGVSLTVVTGVVGVFLESALAVFATALVATLLLDRKR
jgi:hypothetical protein